MPAERTVEPLSGRRQVPLVIPYPVPPLLLERFWSQVEFADCWTWLGSRNKDGYGSLSFGGKNYRVHRVSWVIHYGAIPPMLDVCHSCDNPPCVRPDHLWLGTAATNAQDMARKGRAGVQRHPEIIKYGDESTPRLHPESLVRGEAVHGAKLSAPEVIAIREEYAAGGISQMALAVRYGVSEGMIRLVVHGRNWAHVPGPVVPRRMLTWTHVREIRERFAAGEPRAALAEVFGVSAEQIRKIVRNVEWVGTGPAAG